MSEGNFEGLLHSMRRSKDGMVVSFVVQPNDISNDLLTLNIGARVMIGWSECTDAPKESHAARLITEKQVSANPVPPRGLMHCAANGGDAQASPREPKQKRAFKDLSYPEQAGIRCGEIPFVEFLSLIDTGSGITDPAEYVRHYCGVKSRAELSTNRDALNKWRDLEIRYQNWLTERRYAESIYR